VAPIYVAWNLIYTNPGDAFFFREKLSKALYFFRIFPDDLMADHAFCLRRKGHHLAGSGIDVTAGALEVECARVLEVTEGDGLFGRI